MDIEALRTFVAVSETGRFQAAADELGVTQQAVSKRVARLERDLGVRLFTRSARGTTPNASGRALLPHARELLSVASRAKASLVRGSRAFRVDVLNRRTAPATALHAFHRALPGHDLDVVTLPDADLGAVVDAVTEGRIDVTFRSVGRDPRALPVSVCAESVLDDRHEVLVGPEHPLADAPFVSITDLAAHQIWMPGMRPGTEWSAYYRELSREFGLRIDSVGPTFGTDALLEELAGSRQLATLVGEGSRYLWPETYDLRRIPVVDPTPVYPHAVIWRTDNGHPALGALLAHLRAERDGVPAISIWRPPWSLAPDGGPLAGARA